MVHRQAPNNLLTQFLAWIDICISDQRRGWDISCIDDINNFLLPGVTYMNKLRRRYYL